MTKTNKDIQDRDFLFYSDLVYEIKRLAGFSINNDAAINEKIKKEKRMLKKL